MGSIRKLTQAELQQHERNQQAPEFLEWLAGMDADLERFLTEGVAEGSRPHFESGARVVAAGCRT
jgi:hypothetical protein